MIKRFFIQLFHYEYWPMWAFYFPLFFYFLYKGISKGRLFYFTNVNNGFDAYGGLFFDSKTEVDAFIPDTLKPKSILVNPGDFIDDMVSGFTFPVIVKPDKGGRGKGVIKIKNIQSLKQHISELNAPALIQEYIDFPLEYGVFICYLPETNTYDILSLTFKKFFSISGNGHSNIKELVLQHDRGIVFQKAIERLSEYPLDMVPEDGQVLFLHTIGNHSLGTEFNNHTQFITSEMKAKFNEMLSGADVFEYGRFDIKVKILKDLETFEYFKIIEFNGLAAEPIHIYDETIGFMNALKIFIQHWSYLDSISDYQNIRGIKAKHTNRILSKIWH